MAEASYIPRLKMLYNEQLRSELREKFSYGNIMQVPRLDKIVINMGVGEAVSDRKKLQNAVSEMALICGQQPVVCLAKQSNASFKLRDGMGIGCKVTLRSTKMYDFLDRLVNIALPRVRDFRGLKNKAFDGRGNYALGIREQIVFPEINYDKIDEIRGFDIVICTTAKSNDEARALLSGFNLPFSK